MRLTIRFETGLRVEALLLAAGTDRMRITIPAQRDAVELARLGDSWYAENGEAVEVEAVIPVEGTDYSRFCAEMAPRTMAAGRSFLA